MAAFERGLAAGADGLELDVHLSSDGVVVVCHDAMLDRTTDASGRIDRRTAAELSRVDAGYRWTDPPGKHPFRSVASASRGFAMCSRRFTDVPIIIEMKVDHPEMGQALAAEVLAASAVDRVCVASDGCRAIRAAREALPAMATSACRWEIRLALYRSWAHWPVRRTGYGGYQVPETAGAIRVVSPLLSDTHTMRDSRCTSGRWMTRQTWIDCWPGVSTRLDQQSPRIFAGERSRSVHVGKAIAGRVAAIIGGWSRRPTQTSSLRSRGSTRTCDRRRCCTTRCSTSGLVAACW